MSHELVYRGRGHVNCRTLQCRPVLPSVVPYLVSVDSIYCSRATAMDQRSLGRNPPAEGEAVTAKRSRRGDLSRRLLCTVMRSRKQCRRSLRVNGQSLPCEILSSRRRAAAEERRGTRRVAGRKNERYNDNNAHATEEDKPSRAPEGAVRRFCIPRPRCPPTPPSQSRKSSRTRRSCSTRPRRSCP